MAVGGVLVVRRELRTQQEERVAAAGSASVAILAANGAKRVPLKCDVRLADDERIADDARLTNITRSDLNGVTIVRTHSSRISYPSLRELPVLLQLHSTWLDGGDPRSIEPSFKMSTWQLGRSHTASSTLTFYSLAIGRTSARDPAARAGSAGAALCMIRSICPTTCVRQATLSPMTAKRMSSCVQFEMVRSVAS